MTHKRYAIVPGRWSPLHIGHVYIVDQLLGQGKNVCIMIRDTELSDQDPYTAEQRREMWRRVYGDRIKTMIVPDIESINIGRNVGFDLNEIEVPAHIAEISATAIRKGDQSNVPPQVREYLKLLGTTIWLTGLPCAGKTTIGKHLKREMQRRGYSVVHLDGEDVRAGLNADLDFSDAGRRENLRRIAHMAQLLNSNHIFVVASFVSPTNAMRNLVRGIIENLKLVYVKCSLETCSRRDTKGMYARATGTKGPKIENFTGISAPFDEPDADVTVDAENRTVEECTETILISLSGRTAP